MKNFKALTLIIFGEHEKMHAEIIKRIPSIVHIAKFILSPNLVHCHMVDNVPAELAVFIEKVNN